MAFNSSALNAVYSSFVKEGARRVLERTGVTQSEGRYEASSTFQINGIAVSQSQSAGRLVKLTFPTPPKSQFSLVQEGVAHKALKWFQSELQTGDAPFDDTVYVKTTTTDATSAVLSLQMLRQELAELVGGGGTVTIDGPHVEVRVPDGAPAAVADSLGVALLAVDSLMK